MEYTKQDETTIALVKEPIMITPEPEVYDLDSLKERELDLLENRNRICIEADAQLVEIRTLLAECEKAGLRSKKVVEAEKAQAELEAKQIADMESAKDEVAKREAELEALNNKVIEEQVKADTLTINP